MSCSWFMKWGEKHWIESYDGLIVKQRLLVVWADVHFYIGEVQKILSQAGIEPVLWFVTETWVLGWLHKIWSEKAIYNDIVLKYRTPRRNSFLMWCWDFDCAGLLHFTRRAILGIWCQALTIVRGHVTCLFHFLLLWYIQYEASTTVNTKSQTGVVGLRSWSSDLRFVF